MEGTISEIRLFAADFAPRSWAFCQGQTLAISTNQALFSLLGTTYGGNGVQTFQLPDLRSRVPVGTGSGLNGALNMQLGQIGGEESHVITLNELPAHTHTAAITGTLIAPPPSGITFYGSSGSADSPDPSNNLFGDTGGAAAIYADGNSDTVAMATNAIALAVNLSGNPTMTFQPSGSNAAHTNLQPYIGINYVICLQGLFPSRN